MLLLLNVSNAYFTKHPAELDQPPGYYHRSKFIHDRYSHSSFTLYLYRTFLFFNSISRLKFSFPFSISFILCNITLAVQNLFFFYE